MWHTSTGDRTLEAAEARLIAETLWNLGLELQLDQGDYDVGIEAFDRLTYGQKVTLLCIIGNGLLKSDVPIRNLTAVVEAAIAAVFEYLKFLINIEVNVPVIKTNWRTRILDACQQVDFEYLPKENSKDEYSWVNQIKALSDLILWDYDFADEDLYIDASPEEAESLKKLMGIHDDYFQEVPEDLKPAEIEAKLMELKTICRSVAKKSYV